jgi:hypothetical protein
MEAESKLEMTKLNAKQHELHESQDRGQVSKNMR